MSNLKKALYTLLYDQSDSADLEIDDTDETYIEYIVSALIEKNGSTCPFKNYECTSNCKLRAEKCNEAHTKIDCDIECGIEKAKVWKHFIGIDSE